MATTWNDLLFPDVQSASHIPLLHVDSWQMPHSSSPVQTSSFSPVGWDPNRLPSSVHLARRLPFDMDQDLRRIVTERYANQAAGSQWRQPDGFTMKADFTFDMLRYHCQGADIFLHHEPSITELSVSLSHMVRPIFGALTGNRVAFDHKVAMDHREVITDYTYELGGMISIIFEANSPMAFDLFLGQLMGLLESSDSQAEGLDLFPQTVSTTYEGYHAILAKISYHATSLQRRARWAIIFSGLRYIIIHIQHSAHRPTFYCSQTMTFCLKPGDSQVPDAQPPIWSLLVYMLLTETLDRSDENLRQQLHLPVLKGHMPFPLPCLGTQSRLDAQGNQSHRQAPGGMEVRCLDSQPITLLPVSTARFLTKTRWPSVHLDRYLGSAWSSVYASSKSRIVVKFAKVAKKKKAELEHQLRNEIAAYEKLVLLARWVVPICYGEYKWYGGRALILSEEGPSLEDLEMDFMSLDLVERVVLYGKLCLIHWAGICQQDFEPRNILRKGWCRLKIIDFSISDTNHACPGWGSCQELREAWHEKLQLDRLPFKRDKVRLIAFMVCGLFLLFLRSFFISLKVW